MKILKKTSSVFLTAFVLGALLFAAAPAPAKAAELPAVSSVQVKKDVIKWKYKTVNGKVYRRKYNYSKGIWIGDWEYVRDAF